MITRGEIVATCLSGIETAINNYLKLAPATLEQLAALEGKVIAVELRGLDITLYLLPGADGLHVLSEYTGTPDTTLSGSPLSLAEMALGSDATRVLFSGDVIISGEIELGQQFKHLLDEMDIDWEEHLSKLTGDVIAHKVGQFVHDTQQWSEQAINTLTGNLGEYLQQESQDLPSHADVDQFLADVDVLRDDVERLEARFNRIQTAITQKDQEQ